MIEAPDIEVEIRPFQIPVLESELADLGSRLDNTRWPEPETVSDWSQGMPLSYTTELAEYWSTSYDWKTRAALLNRFDHYKTMIDGLDIHFIHQRSPHEGALPVVFSHGWPGSFVEFTKVIQPLTDPTAFGGRAEDAIHVVCPSLPGFGYSDKPSGPGWNVARIATAWDDLMARLGYEQYGAQGGDWGAAITTQIGRNAGRCIAIHTNRPIGRPTKESKAEPTQDESRYKARLADYQNWDAGYSKLQGTRPQTLGYGLADSPVGQMAWIVEKFARWMDCDGDPETVLSKDELLDNVMIYWLTNTATSSARIYWESFDAFSIAEPVRVPTGVAAYPAEIIGTSRRWCEAHYNITHWADMAKGGHFAAYEQPELFANDVRRFFASL